ncbi:MAG: hypothetical protein E7472_05515 [Ruminococcaceae bacterium]|nr:hypothetical protein [Oscillospiraceae bacterium]
MADNVLPGPVANSNCNPGCVNIHTSKILDACRDKDCIDDLRVYPTASSQTVIDTAFSVRPESAELIYADVNVDAINFNRGYYTVDVTYFYLITGETFPGGVPVRGLAVFDKRVILYGSEGGVKTFTSLSQLSEAAAGAAPDPVAVVEAVDPIALNLRIADPPAPGTPDEPALTSVPSEILAIFGEDLIFSQTVRRLYVTLGQFSIIRLERDYQFTVCNAENFMPEKECIGNSDDDPCTLFSRVRFPVEEFYPPDTIPCCECYRDLV